MAEDLTQPAIEQIINESLSALLKSPWFQTGQGWRRLSGLQDTTADVDVWSTAEVLILLRTLKEMNFPFKDTDGISNTIKTVQELLVQAQKPDGGWSHQEISNASGTALALWALSTRDSLEKHAGVFDAGLAWLDTHHSEQDGAWSLDGPHARSTTYDTCIVLLMTKELPLSLRTRPTVHSKLRQRGIDYLFAAQNEDGGWGNRKDEGPSRPQDTALAVYTLFEVVEDRTYDRLIRRGLQALKENQQVDDGWVDVETISWAILAYLSAGNSPQSSHVRKAVQTLLSLRLHASGWGTVGEPITYLTVYALLALGTYWRALSGRHKPRRGQLTLRQRLFNLFVARFTWTLILLGILIVGILIFTASLAQLFPTSFQPAVAVFGGILTAVTVVVSLARSFARRD